MKKDNKSQISQKTKYQTETKVTKAKCKTERNFTKSEISK